MPQDNSQETQARVTSGQARRSRQALNRLHKAVVAQTWDIYDIFEGTAEIQQLVIARQISGVHIR